MPAPTGLTCEAINDIFNRETGRILGPSAYMLGQFTSPWLRAIPQSEWPNHMGTIINQAITQRAIPASPEDWTSVGVTGGTNENACLPPVEILPYAVDNKTFSLQHVAIESQPICLETVRTNNAPIEEIRNQLQNFTNYADTKWIDRFRDEYQRLADHKVVVAPGLPEDSADFPSTDPTSQLTLDILKIFRHRMIRDNAGTRDMIPAGSGEPVFKVITSPEQADNMRKLNNEIREDFRWNQHRVGELFYGMEKSYHYAGLEIESDVSAPRYNSDGAGGFTRVPIYTTEDASKGTKAEVNPAYETAEFEVTFICHPDVYHNLMPSPNVNLGSTVAYTAQNYRGEYRFVNEYDRTCNPDRGVGYLRAKLMNASKPLHTRWGYAILHLRCDPPLNLIACSDSPSPSGSA